jgi:hypothetical protein
MRHGCIPDRKDHANNPSVFDRSPYLPRFFFWSHCWPWVGGTDTRAGKRTVCTITVNLPDEKEMFRQRLPEDQYQFVEFVERGRPDWLASACRQGVRCDLLVVSGHFDGSTEFYSDQLAASEFLPVVEIERASCSDSGPGLFSQLKEVYLFGCDTLNADAVKSMSSDVGRSLVRAGRSQAVAQRLAGTLDQRHGESGRDRMRRIFMNVPVIYGFSSIAPLGPTAAIPLGRYLRTSSIAEVGSGRASPSLLGHFATESMIAVSGLSESDPRRPSARGLSIHRRPAVPGGETRLHPWPPAPRHGGSPHVPRAHQRSPVVSGRLIVARTQLLWPAGEKLTVPVM